MMTIKEILNKKKEIIETYRENDKNLIRKELDELSKKIFSDKELLDEVLAYNIINKYVFVITDQFLICRYRDEFEGCIFSNHKINGIDGKNKEYIYNIKFPKEMKEPKSITLIIIQAYIKDPYFCINFDPDGEYLPSTIYKDLINI